MSQLERVQHLAAIVRTDWTRFLTDDFNLVARESLDQADQALYDLVHVEETDEGTVITFPDTLAACAELLQMMED